MTAIQKSVPALRFKDSYGKDYPYWEEKNLKGIGKFRSGVGFPHSEQGGTEGTPFYKVSDMNLQGNESEMVVSNNYVSEKQIKKLKITPIKQTAIIFAKVGAAIFLERKRIAQNFFIDNNMMAFLPAVHLQFMKYVFDSVRLSKYAQTGALPSYNQSDLETLKITIPVSEKEQQKIAAFLSSVDSKIEQLTKKKTLLEQYKKGMMQKLFSQQLRFKDEKGRDYSDWEEVKFKHLYSFRTTNSFSRNKLNYVNGTVRNLHYGDIHTRYQSIFELDRENVPFLNLDINLSSVSEDAYCKEGDLVIADASEDYNGIGKTIELLNLNGESVLAGLHTLLAKRNSGRIHIGYGAYVMACSIARKQIMRIAQGTKVLGISVGRMNEIELPIPSKKEQQKIVDFLSAIDGKIKLVAEQIKQAQAFKKGLFQQMFI